MFSNGYSDFIIEEKNEKARLNEFNIIIIFIFCFIILNIAFLVSNRYKNKIKNKKNEYEDELDDVSNASKYINIIILVLIYNFLIILNQR